jgi:signal peptidase I
MKEYPPIEVQDAARYDQDELPRLKMVEEKPLRASGPTLILRSATPAPTGLSGSRLERCALIALCIGMSALTAYYLVARFVVTSVVIPSPGASREAHQGERYHVNRWRYVWVAPQPGDRVVVEQHHNLSLRRVIARPSDWLNVKHGVIYVNGRKLEESLPHWSPATGGLTDKMVQLGRDQYYLLVEAPGNDSDARPGVVLGRNILGRVTN